MSSCEHEDKPAIEYPATGFYGDNILSKEMTAYTHLNNSLQAKIPKDQKLIIIVTGITAMYPTGIWYYAGSTSNNWAVSDFDMATNKQTFTSIDGGLTCDLQIQFDKGTFQIDYYENGSASPTSTKTIEVNY